MGGGKREKEREGERLLHSLTVSETKICSVSISPTFVIPKRSMTVDDMADRNAEGVLK